MSLGFTALLRNARADAITVKRDADAAAGKIRIYSGTRPATGGAVTTQLAELTFAAVSSLAAASGVLTAEAIVGDASADAAGTATWFRELDGANLFVMDGDIGLSGSGADLILNDVVIASGVPVDISSNVITEGNA